jgi:hypothetical protein
MTTSIPINYKRAWTNMYVFVGVLCILIFLLGFIMVGDYMNLVYILASIVPIYIGFHMRKSPYAVVSRSKIEVFGLFGELKHVYECDEKSTFLRRNNKIFIQTKEGMKKIKMNKWCVNQGDWNRVLVLIE